MASLPDAVQVGPYRYTVAVNDTRLNVHRVEAQRGRGNIGYTDNCRLETVIAEGLPPTLLAETLLHEVLHMVLEATGCSEAKMTDEQFIRHCAPSLLATLQQNPALVAFLMAPEGDDAVA